MGRWVLPGGFVRLGEAPEDAVSRVLEEKAGLSGIFTEQLFTFGSPARDSRGHVISIAYYALVTLDALEAASATGDVSLFDLHVPWAGEKGGDVRVLAADGTALPVAFDHAAILGTAVLRLRGKCWYTPVVLELAGAEFTLAEAQAAYEAVNGHAYLKQTFRERIRTAKLVEATGKVREGAAHRPAATFRAATPKEA